MGKFSEITPEITKLSKKCEGNSRIDPELYDRYDVKRGLRYKSGRGVLAGLTEIGEVKSYTIDDGEMIPCDGKLYYRGVDIENIVDGFSNDNRFGYEEVAYLLLFGEQPAKDEISEFKGVLSEYRNLHTSFIRDVIMKAPSKDLMNTMAKSVLTLYAYDDRADDISVDNVLRQSLQLIAMFPLMGVYGYHVYNHTQKGGSLYIHTPPKELSTAEAILYMLRPDTKFTQLEAKLLDICLVAQAEHGGGNNSTFTTHVVSSSGTDTYSSVAASLCSLKGPKHGGANKKVSEMFADIKNNVSDWEDEDEVREYLKKILNKEAFDRSGLIYGIGHAVYSLSDPRTTILKKYVGGLAAEKGKEKELKLYRLVEEIAPELLKGKRNRPVSANVDFYSGFVFSMLGLPEELYTPVFAMARIAGWSAHRLEEIMGSGKIVRPAYKNVAKHTPYIPIEER